MANVNINFLSVFVASQLQAQRGAGVNFVQRFLAIAFVAQKRSSTTVRVDFNQPLRSRAATTVAANYTITGPSVIGVSSVAFTPGNSFVTLTVTGVFQLGTYTLNVAASTVEASQTDGLTNAAGSTDFIADAADNTAPVISNVTPADGSQIDASTQVGFRLSDSFGNLNKTTVLAYYPTLGRFEVVWFGAFTWSGGSRAAGFGPQYQGTRTVTTPGTQYDFAGVIRKGGWPAMPVLLPDPIDDSGNEVA